MKPARIILGLAVLLIIANGIYWRTKSAPTPSPTPEAIVAPKIATVEQPVVAPIKKSETANPVASSTVGNAANAAVLATNHQDMLNSLLKFQTELEQSLAGSTDPKEREALQQELDHLQIQIQYEMSSASPRAVVTTNLGEIVLAESKSVQRKLASGDMATFTATTTAEGTWSVNIIVRHVDANGNASVESTSLTAQSGQTADLKVTGNEIHFTPVAAATTLSK